MPDKERMQMSRLRNSTGKNTLLAAMKASDQLRRMGVPMPPPWTPVQDDEDYEWIRLGRTIRTLDAKRFAELLADAQRVSSGLEEVAQALDEFKGHTGLQPGK